MTHAAVGTGVRAMRKARDQSGHFHAVRFYVNQEALCRIVAEFLSEGLFSGEPGLVIGTPAHNAEILQQLAALRFDVDAIRAAGNLVFLDAQAMLAAFMVDGVPDSDLFKTEAAKVLERLSRGRTDLTVRAYGEMVDLLWKGGCTVAAVKLEVLWNQLAMTHDFSLLCGYAMGNFYKNAGISEICSQHTHAISADGSIAPLGESDRPIS
jgi:MEDS: MEthanogen/methylotroph, DcmR Sensory domain